MLNKNNVFCVSLNNINNENRILNTREKFNKQAKDFGIKFKYFDAIYGDGVKLFNDNNKQNDKETMGRTSCGIKFKYKPTELITPHCSNPVLPFYYIGCALSHLSLYEQLLFDKDNDFYLIFEDDFIFNKSVNYQNILNDVTNLPKDADICFFAPPHSSPYVQYSKEHDVNDYVYKMSKHNGISGTSMYLITKAGAEKLLNIDGMNVNFNSDELLSKCFHILNAYCTHKIYGYGHLERMGFDNNIITRLNLNYEDN